MHFMSQFQCEAQRGRVSTRRVRRHRSIAAEGWAAVADKGALVRLAATPPPPQPRRFLIRHAKPTDPVNPVEPRHGRAALNG